MPTPTDDPERVPATDPHVTVELYSQPRYLAGARDLVSAVSKRFGFTDSECGRVALAVDEALCNVIRHGYGQDASGRIWVRLWPLSEATEGEAEGIRVVIEDEARQVDPEAIRGRDLEEVRPGGLGVFIMREVMSSVHFERRGEGKGMRLIMTKRVHADSTSTTPEGR